MQMNKDTGCQMHDLRFEIADQHISSLVTAFINSRRKGDLSHGTLLFFS